MLSDIANKRLGICKTCPLYKESKNGAVCNSRKYMNADGEWSYFKKDGFKPGCGCSIHHKIQWLSNKCPHNKW